MINLHESKGLGRDRNCDPWICSQTRICSQTGYRLRYAVLYILTCAISMCMQLSIFIYFHSLCVLGAVKALTRLHILHRLPKLYWSKQEAQKSHIEQQCKQDTKRELQIYFQYLMTFHLSDKHLHENQFKPNDLFLYCKFGNFRDNFISMNSIK